VVSAIVKRSNDTGVFIDVWTRVPGTEVAKLKMRPHNSGGRITVRFSLVVILMAISASACSLPKPDSKLEEDRSGT